MANSLSDGAQKALRLFSDGRGYHDQLCQRILTNKRAFNGDLIANSEAADWVSKLHPPYIKHIVKTTLAGLVDDRFTFKVRPADRFYGPGEYEIAAQGAKAHELLHKCQLKQDRFNEKLWPHAQQDAIVGLTVTKTYWTKRFANKGRLTLERDEASGLPKMVPTPVQREVTYDGPTTEIVDIEDFYWDEAAPHLDRSRWMAHRTYMSYEEVAQLEKDGRFKNTAVLKDNKAQAQSDDYKQLTKDNRDRSKHRIEVLEIWYMTSEGWRTVTLGDRYVELVEDRANPFWHGTHPFVACSTSPTLFSVAGDSMVESIEHIQRAVWDLTNQTMDGVRLLANPIYTIRSDVDDPDGFPIEPGAKWIVDDPSQTSVFKQDLAVAEVTMPHLQRLETQMQNLAGSQPFTSTSEGQINASTATQAALVTDLASRSIQAQKNQLYQAYERIGQLRTELNQQFIRTPVVVSEIGIDDQQEFTTIVPTMLQGYYLFDVSAMAESQMRAERKAEEQGKLQMAIAYVPVAAQLAQAGVASFPNMDRFVKDWLEANDVKNPDAYLTKAQPPPMQAPAPQQQASPSGPGGVTAPQSIDPAVSPSNQSSISPTVFGQRAAAFSGQAAA